MLIFNVAFLKVYKLKLSSWVLQFIYHQIMLNVLYFYVYDSVIPGKYQTRFLIRLCVFSRESRTAYIVYGLFIKIQPSTIEKFLETHLYFIFEKVIKYLEYSKDKRQF